MNKQADRLSTDFKWNACAGKAQHTFALHDLLLKNGKQSPFQPPGKLSAGHQNAGKIVC